MILLLSIVIFTFLLCFAISHLFLSYYIYEKSKDENVNVKNDYFSYIFGLSNVLLILIICEIAKVDNLQIRNFIWLIILWCFIGIMFYIIPYFFMYWIICIDNTITTKIKYYSRRILLLIFYAFYLISANKFFFLIKQSDDSTGFLIFYFFPTYMMEFLAVIGIILSAILSGYGSTHIILNYLIYPYFKSTIQNLMKKFKDSLSSVSEAISLRENEMHLITSDNNEENEEGNIKNSFSPRNTMRSTIKGVYNYVIGKNNKNDMKEEIKELKLLYNEMEMQIKLLRDKTIYYRENFISDILNFYKILYNIYGKILAVYCIYRILMTLRSLIFFNYSKINTELRQEMSLDVILNFIFALLKVDVDNLYYTVIEQYFSLIIVGQIIITNIRGFLNTIFFIYTKTIKNYNKKVSQKVQLLFLSYFVGLFYVASSIFLIFNLPITYRTEVVNIYGDLDYSLLRHLNDKTFIISVIISAIVEGIMYHLQFLL
jgi:hypothetical protein